MERRTRIPRLIGTAWQQAGHAVGRASSRLESVELGVVPPPMQTLGSSTTGEVVTAVLIAWARTMVVWSLLACGALGIVLLIRILFG